jgi:murein DD-endopeptidase MepM/ murein hydrolase activator NlpD
VKKAVLFVLAFGLLFITVSMLVPLRFVVPVKGAHRGSYDQKSFWAYPWGTSGHHKGVDIFARKGTPVLSATSGLVVYTGVFSKGGNVVLLLDRSLKYHYYAHLEEIGTAALHWVGAGEEIGKVGTTGNAKGKPPHLHYSISRIIPRWDAEGSWNKRFYDDPVKRLNAVLAEKN